MVHGQRRSRSAEQCRRKQFEFGKVVGFQDLAAQTGAAVGDSPAVAVGVFFPVEGDAVQMEFLARVPHQRPAAVTGYTFALAVGLSRAVDFRASRDDETAIMIDAVGDQRDNRRLNRRGVNGHDQFARNQPSVWRVELAQGLGFRLSGWRFGVQADGSEFLDKRLFGL